MSSEITRPARWGCAKHWFALPKEIRDRLWAAFAPGQEVSGRPSREYVGAARAALRWIGANFPPDD